MSNIVSKLKIPGGTTYDIKDEISGYTTLSMFPNKIVSDVSINSTDNSMFDVTICTPAATGPTVSETRTIDLHINKVDRTGDTMTGDLILASGSLTQRTGTSITCGSYSGTGTGADSTHAIVAKNMRGKIYLDAHIGTNYATSWVSVNGCSNNGSDGADDIRMLFRSCSLQSATYLGGYVDGTYNSFALGGSSGARWDTVPVTSSTGVTEIGKYLDFHATDGDTTNFTYRLVNTGDGACTYSGTWTKASSIKVKENIEDITLAEAQGIFELRPVKFDYKQGAKDSRGFIAEEVELIFPNLVSPEVGEEGTPEWVSKSLDYESIIPYLVKIIQDQEKRIIYLENKINK